MPSARRVDPQRVRLRYLAECRGGRDRGAKTRTARALGITPARVGQILREGGEDNKGPSRLAGSKPLAGRTARKTASDMTPPQVATFNHYVALRPAAIVLPEPKAWRWNWNIKVEGEPTQAEILHNAVRARRRANVAYGLFAAVLVALVLELIAPLPWSPFVLWFRLAWGGAVLALGHVAAKTGREIRSSAY